MSAHLPPLKTRLRTVAIIVLVALVGGELLRALESQSPAGASRTEAVFHGVFLVLAVVLSVQAWRQFRRRDPSDRSGHYSAASRLCFGGGFLLLFLSQFIRSVTPTGWHSGPLLVVAGVGAALTTLALVFSLVARRHLPPSSDGAGRLGA